MKNNRDLESKTKNDKKEKKTPESYRDEITAS